MYLYTYTCTSIWRTSGWVFIAIFFRIIPHAWIPIKPSLRVSSAIEADEVTTCSKNSYALNHLPRLAPLDGTRSSALDLRNQSIETPLRPIKCPPPATCLVARSTLASVITLRFHQLTTHVGPFHRTYDWFMLSTDRFHGWKPQIAIPTSLALWVAEVMESSKMVFTEKRVGFTAINVVKCFAACWGVDGEDPHLDCYDILHFSSTGCASNLLVSLCLGRMF